MDEDQHVPDPTGIFYWECLTRPLTVGKRFNSRLFVNENYLWGEEPATLTDTSSGAEPRYFLRAQYCGVVSELDLFKNLSDIRHKQRSLSPRFDRTDTPARHTPLLTLSPPPLFANHERTHSNSQSSHRGHAHHRPSDLGLTKPIPSGTATHLHAESSPIRAVKTFVGGLVKVASRANMAPDASADKTDPNFLKEFNRFTSPLDRNVIAALPLLESPNRQRYFAVSEPVDFRLRGAPRMTESSDQFRCFPLYGTFPSFAPPSYLSSTIEYNYTLYISIMKCEESEVGNNYTTLYRDEYSLRVFASSKSLLPILQLVGDSMSISNGFPPGKMCLKSLTYLWWCFESGRMVADSPEPPVVLPFGVFTELSPTELRDILEESDRGWSYLGWASSLFGDKRSGNPLNTQRGSYADFAQTTNHHQTMLSQYLSVDDIDNCNKLLRDRIEEVLSVGIMAKKSLPLYAPNRKIIADNGRMTFEKFPTSSSADLDTHRLSTLNALWKRNDDYDLEVNVESSVQEFRCTDDDIQESIQAVPSRIRVSIRNQFICEMEIHGATFLSSEEERLIWPTLLECSKPPKAITVKGALLQVQSGSSLTLVFDFSLSKATVVEIQVRLIAVEMILVPPLSPSQMLNKLSSSRGAPSASGSRGGSAADKWRRLSSTTEQDEAETNSQISELLVSQDEAGAGRILYSRARCLVTKYVHSVLQKKQSTFNLEIPADVPSFFTTERVCLYHELEVDFLCVSSNGDLLDIASTPKSSIPRRPSDSTTSKGPTTPSGVASPGSGKTESDNGRNNGTIPFLVLNGPLLPRNTLTATWSTRLLVTNNSKKTDLLPLVQSQRSLSEKELRERLQLVMRGTAAARFKLRKLFFDHHPSVAPL